MDLQGPSRGSQDRTLQKMTICTDAFTADSASKLAQHILKRDSNLNHPEAELR